MSDAYIETTILTDILLKPKSPKQQRAKKAFDRFEKTLLPVYSIKELKAGPLDYFGWLHDKLVLTQSWADTAQAIASLPRGYRQSTATEAVAAAAKVLKSQPQKYGMIGNDRDLADRYRLALVSIIQRGWRKRRKITTEVVDDLPCYTEAEPHVGKDGLLDLTPQKCDPEQECCLGPRLKSQPELLEALRDAIPENSSRLEDQKRRKALKRLVKHPGEKLDRETCRDLGDAVFAFFCPKDAVILTTNLRDHQPLAASLGKKAEKP